MILLMGALAQGAEVAPLDDLEASLTRAALWQAACGDDEVVAAALDARASAAVTLAAPRVADAGGAAEVAALAEQRARAIEAWRRAEAEAMTTAAERARLTTAREEADAALAAAWSRAEQTFRDWSQEPGALDVDARDASTRALYDLRADGVSARAATWPVPSPPLFDRLTLVNLDAAVERYTIAVVEAEAEAARTAADAATRLGEVRAHDDAWRAATEAHHGEAVVDPWVAGDQDHDPDVADAAVDADAAARRRDEAAELLARLESITASDRGGCDPSMTAALELLVGARPDPADLADRYQTVVNVFLSDPDALRAGAWPAVTQQRLWVGAGIAWSLAGDDARADLLLTQAAAVGADPFDLPFVVPVERHRRAWSAALAGARAAGTGSLEVVADGPVRVDGAPWTPEPDRAAQPLLPGWHLVAIGDPSDAHAAVVLVDAGATTRFVAEGAPARPVAPDPILVQAVRRDAPAPAAERPLVVPFVAAGVGAAEGRPHGTFAVTIGTPGQTAAWVGLRASLPTEPADLGTADALLWAVADAQVTRAWGGVAPGVGARVAWAGDAVLGLGPQVSLALTAGPVRLLGELALDVTARGAAQRLQPGLVVGLAPGQWAPDRG